MLIFSCPCLAISAEENDSSSKASFSSFLAARVHLHSSRSFLTGANPRLLGFLLSKFAHAGNDDISGVFQEQDHPVYGVDVKRLDAMSTILGLGLRREKLRRTSPRCFWPRLCGLQYGPRCKKGRICGGCVLQTHRGKVLAPICKDAAGKRRARLIIPGRSS